MVCELPLMVAVQEHAVISLLKVSVAVALLEASPHLITKKEREMKKSRFRFFMDESPISQV